MIVIEGKSGKSKALEHYINEETTGKAVVLDSVGVFGLNVREGVEHLIFKGISTREMNAIAVNEAFNDCEWIALEMNADVNEVDMEALKHFDEITKPNWIVTLQNNEMEELKVYQL